MLVNVVVGVSHGILLEYTYNARLTITFIFILNVLNWIYKFIII